MHTYNTHLYVQIEECKKKLKVILVQITQRFSFCTLYGY